MSTGATTGAVGQLDKRDVRALTEYLYAFDDLGWAADAEGCWLVYAEDGTEHRVDAVEGACDCDDAFYRDPDGGCKHVRRVRFVTGEREIPVWADRSCIDPWLLEQRAER